MASSVYSQTLAPIQLLVDACDTIQIAEAENYLWTSGNQDVVMVDKNGVVCGVNPGSTYVAAVSKNTSASYRTEITVVGNSGSREVSSSSSKEASMCSTSSSTLEQLISQEGYQKTDSRLKVAENQRLILWSDGAPFLFLSQTLWSMARRLTREEIINVLDICEAQGFTAIQFIAHAHYMGANRYGDIPFEDENFACPRITLGNNPEDSVEYDWWDHVEFIVQESMKRGMVVCLLPTWREQWNQKNNLNESNALAYGKFIGARFQHLNDSIIWVMGGDAAPDTEAKLNIHRDLARGIALAINGQEDYGNLMMTYHTHGPTITNDYISEAEPFMDFNTIQSGHSLDNLEGMMVASYSSQNKPTVDFEPLYDKNGQLIHETRTTIYWGIFQGGFGTSYGNWNIWHCGARDDIARFQIPESFEQSFGTQIRHLGQLLLSHPMEWRVPKPELLVNNGTEGAYRILAMSATDSTYAYVYSPTGASFKVDLGLLKNKKLRYQWFNPRTGAIEAKGTFSHDNEAQTFHPPSQGEPFTGHDWVLMLD
ncbi:MAG: DUF4038 domain-containing protein [Bacteroidota bacterium]